MKRLFHICIILMYMFVVACQETGLDNEQAGAPIYLLASIEEPSLTRTPYTVEAPSSKYPLRADVWGSTTSNLYKEEINEANGKPYDGSTEDGKVAIHTDATFQSGEPQLLRSAIYNQSTKPTVYFVAFVPMSQGQKNWSTADGKQASYTFSGNDDVMFAPQVEGTYGQEYSKSPLLKFGHLLTWIRVEFKAESMEVSNSWGAIRSMTIRSMNSLIINLENNNVTYGGDLLDMNFYRTLDEEVYDGSEITHVKKFTDNVFPETGQLIPYLKTEELAYVLCAPVDGKDKIVVNGEDVDAAEYYIDLVTEKRTVTIPVDLRSGEKNPFLGTTRGYQFTLSLNFKMGNTIYVSSSVNDWKVGGLVIGGLGDDSLTAN